MEGGPAAEAFNQKLQEMIDSRNLFDNDRSLLITTQRNFGGMVDASAEATRKIEADAAAQADAVAISNKKAYESFEVRRAREVAGAQARERELANMTAAEVAAQNARMRAADAAIAKDNALVAVTQAAKDAVTGLETAMNALNGVIGNQNLPLYSSTIR
jgi:membrane protein involved in colicin uptake